MTASTAEFAARFERTLPTARAKSQPPEHALPFTAIAVGTAYALNFVPLGPIDYRAVSAAAALGATLLGLALLWSRLPRIAALGIPLGYIALVALLRDAAGKAHRASQASSCSRCSGSLSPQGAVSSSRSSPR